MHNLLSTQRVTIENKAQSSKLSTISAATCQTQAQRKVQEMYNGFRSNM